MYLLSSILVKPLGRRRVAMFFIGSFSSAFSDVREAIPSNHSFSSHTQVVVFAHLRRCDTSGMIPDGDAIYAHTHVSANLRPIVTCSLFWNIFPPRANIP